MTLNPQQFWHVTRREGEIRSRGGFVASSNGESGPGVYLTEDPAHVQKMLGYAPEMRALPVHVDSGLKLLDRGPMEGPGEEEYRRIQRSVDSSDFQSALQRAGYQGVRRDAIPGFPQETVIHDPRHLRLADQ